MPVDHYTAKPYFSLLQLWFFKTAAESLFTSGPCSARECRMLLFRTLVFLSEPLATLRLNHVHLSLPFSVFVRLRSKQTPDWLSLSVSIYLLGLLHCFVRFVRRQFAVEILIRKFL